MTTLSYSCQMLVYLKVNNIMKIQERTQGASESEVYLGEVGFGVNPPIFKKTNTRFKQKCHYWKKCHEFEKLLRKTFWIPPVQYPTQN